MAREVFKNIRKGDRFVSVKDQVRVGRVFVVERRQMKPKRVFMWTMCEGDHGVVYLEFAMRQINDCLERVSNP